MKIQWKRNKKIKPEIVLNKIEEAITKTDDGKIGFSAFKYHDPFAALFSLISISEDVEAEIDKEDLIRRTLTELARKNALNKDSFIKEINEIIKLELASKKEKHTLITSLSSGEPLPFSRLELDEVKIRILKNNPPKKYKDRKDVIANQNKEKFSEHHNGYTRVALDIEARSIYGAVNKTLDSLDITRSLLCLFSNVGMELIGDINSPINKIRKGQVHTLHKSNGSIIESKTFWFEPNFHYSNPFHHKNQKILKKNFLWANSQLEKCPYSSHIKNHC